MSIEKTRRFYYLSNAYADSNGLTKCEKGFKISSSIIDEEGLDRFTNSSRLKGFDGLTVDKMDASESDLTKINKFAIEPLKPEDVKVYKVNLANTKVDRVFDKFSPELLKKYAKTFPGKSVIFNHDKFDGHAVGLVFDATTFEDGQDTVLQVKFYVLSTETELISKINAGIWRHFSISFTQPKYEAVYNTDQTLKYWLLLPNDPKSGRVDEPTEMSIVYLGAQYGSTSTKSVNPGHNQTVTVTTGDEPKPKGKNMRLFIESSKGLFNAFKLDVPEGDGQETALEKGFSERLETILTEAKTASDKVVTEITGKVDGAKDLICNKIVSGQVLSGEIKDEVEAKTTAKTALLGKDISELIELQDQYSRKIALSKKLTLSGAKIEGLEDNQDKTANPVPLPYRSIN